MRISSRTYYLLLLLCGLSMAPLHAQPIPTTPTATQQANNVLRYDVQFTTTQDAKGFVEYVYWNGVDSVVAKTSASDSAMTHDITIMGLVPLKTYRYRAVAFDSTGLYASAWDSLTVAAIPNSVTVGHVLSLTTVAGDPKGLLLSNTAIGDPDRYLQIHNRLGDIIWYERMPGISAASFDGPCQHFAYQPATHSIFVTTCGQVTEVALDGTVLRSLNLNTIAPGWMPHHDVVRIPNGNLLVLASQVDTVDKSSVGGDPNALVVGPGMLEINPNGALVWSWSAFDHLDPLTSPAPGGDWVPKLGPQAINWLDANSLMQDGDGNPMLSLGGSSDVLKLVRNGGTIVWTAGSTGTIEVLPPDTFLHQHGLRPSGPGYYLSFDNQGLGTQSRAIEWWIDFSYINPRFEISWEHVLPVSDFSADDGNVDRVPHGGYVIGSAGGHSITEITNTGSILWQAVLDSSLYRAYWVDDLYARLRPAFVGSTTVCLSTDSLIQLQASVPGGIWSGAFVQGDTFNAVAAGLGLHTVTYTLGPEEFTVELLVDGSANCGVGRADEVHQLIEMVAFPNPLSKNAAQDGLRLRWSMQVAEQLRLEIHSLDGRQLLSRDLGRMSVGEHALRLTAEELNTANGAVILSLITSSGKIGRRIVVVQ